MRRQIALALARHTFEVGEMAFGTGACVVAVPKRGLNRAIEHSVKVADSDHPGNGAVVSVSDLPVVDTETRNALFNIISRSTSQAARTWTRSTSFGRSRFVVVVPAATQSAYATQEQLR